MPLPLLTLNNSSWNPHEFMAVGCGSVAALRYLCGVKRYFIYMAYDGTAYHGWQIQPNGVSVQECLQKALGTLLRREVEVTGAGRTDAGVHARLMVAHFDSEEALDAALMTDKLNRLLPPDVAVSRLQEVSPEAHARFSAVSRTYRYFVTTAKRPFERGYSCRLYQKPDFDRMNEAARTLLEYTDFTSFSKLHTDVKTNNCRVVRSEWEQVDDVTWVFTIKADRFLRNMVRAIVGTLLEVGRGKLTVEGFRHIIEQRDRCQAGTSVPAHALFLEDIEYPSLSPLTPSPVGRGSSDTLGNNSIKVPLPTGEGSGERL